MQKMFIIQKPFYQKFYLSLLRLTTSVAMPYIFDWIFFDDSSELKTWRFRLIRRAATEYPRKVYIFATDIGSVCAYISSCVGVCVAYSNEWAAKALSSG